MRNRPNTLATLNLPL